MKAIHQFVLDSNWRTAWPLTFLPDPIEKRKHGGTEYELEAVLGYLKTQDELVKRTKPAAEESEGEERNHGGAHAAQARVGAPWPGPARQRSTPHGQERAQRGNTRTGAALRGVSAPPCKTAAGPCRGGPS